MIAIPSEIKLESFVILQSHFKFKPFKQLKQNINIKELQKVFRSYEMDIDFTYKVIKDNIIQVFTKIGINQEENATGYKLFVEGAAIYNLEDSDKLSEKTKQNLKYYSTVNILIGYLRNTLMEMTSSAPLGPYILPPVNLIDLFKKKELENEPKKPSTK